MSSSVFSEFVFLDPIKHVLRVLLNGFKNDPFHKFNGVVIFVHQRCLSRKNQREILSKLLLHIKSPTCMVLFSFMLIDFEICDKDTLAVLD